MLNGSIIGLPAIISLSGYNNIENILVVGCGGTGGHLIPHLTRLICAINLTRVKPSRRYTYRARAKPIKLFLADGDVVEEKNIARQHFIQQDVNINKATVMAERYAAAFGIEIGVIPKYLEKLKDFDFFNKCSTGNDTADLVIGCVDNNASRKVIHSWFTQQAKSDKIAGRPTYLYGRELFWIDSGNEEKSGQVVCGHVPSGYSSGGDSLNPFTGKKYKRTRGMFSLPCAAEVYPELLKSDDKFNSELSCAELADSAPQNMQTNVTAAAIIMNFVQKLIMREDLNAHCVEFHIDNAFNTKLNTIENLKAVAKTRRRKWEIST